MDLTTVDPEDGFSLDFSLEANRRRAMTFLERDEPLLLVACPMCRPFGGLQKKISCAKLSPNNPFPNP